MKIQKISALITFTALAMPTSAFAHNNAQCGDPAHKILSVADFNGDGKVDSKDISMLAKEIGSNGKYYALYDHNADGVLNSDDVTLATQDIGKGSTPTDKLLAQMYQRFKHFQNTSGFDEIQSMGYFPLGGPLAGHGQHWMNMLGAYAIAGVRAADPLVAEGINVVSDGSKVPALFWGSAAVPLFNDPSAPSGFSTLDWPTPGGVWNTQHVQAFGSQPPDFFPDTEADMWHAHAGTCLTVRDDGIGPQWHIDAHLSNAECQALPNMQPVEFNGQKMNQWGNFWMLHAWLFDLNPRGVFANIHPCVDPNAASEEEINGGRDVPPFFMQFMH